MGTQPCFKTATVPVAQIKKPRLREASDFPEVTRQAPLEPETLSMAVSLRDDWRSVEAEAQANLMRGF